MRILPILAGVTAIAAAIVIGPVPAIAAPVGGELQAVRGGGSVGGGFHGGGMSGGGFHEGFRPEGTLRDNFASRNTLLHEQGPTLPGNSSSCPQFDPTCRSPN
ncbi:MAG: hypothetical protein WDN49_12800 [Acetobacteraceae bacterium]